MSRWTRPSSIPIPTVWSTFDGKIEINGRKRKYWIQDITDEYRDQVVEYMVYGFNADEPLGKYSKCLDVPELVKHFKDAKREGLKDNLGLLCLTTDENDKPTIAAINCTVLCSVSDPKRNTDKMDFPIFHTINYLKGQTNPFKKFNITEYLDAYGLFVLEKYRGEGLGLELLKAREPLCRACGIKVSITIFTSKISQKLAERAGFKDLYSINYDELERKNPKSRYPGIQEHTKSLRLMYIVYD